MGLIFNGGLVVVVMITVAANIRMRYEHLNPIRRARVIPWVSLRLCNNMNTLE